MCGEAIARAPHHAAPDGPSPRVRGSRRLQRASGVGYGSIPACAGKPVCHCATSCSSRVHPRVCGEAIPSDGLQAGDYGPSPRVRGSRSLRLRPPTAAGSIPACAGKPSPSSREDYAPGVHPRVCGEAGAKCSVAQPQRGPSPRVRGSHLHLGAERQQPGSIPACAGKPSGRGRPVPPETVHPRVCGEARLMFSACNFTMGPSPRVRGSRRPRPGDDTPPRSIPACAGKPARVLLGGQEEGVHPRVCGEAVRSDLVDVIGRGPSPRVRGSRRDV